MASGACSELTALPKSANDIVTSARRAVLATVDAQGRPHAVPVCFALRSGELVTAIDHKPKSGRRLARVANIEANPNASLVFDRWSEDWRRLGWVMVRGTARIDAPGSADAELAARYEQYRASPPRGEVISVHPERILWWTFQ